MSDNLYKRGGVWYGRVNVRGRDVRKSLRTGVKSVAKERRKAMIANAEKIRFDGEQRHTWKAAVGRWTLEQQSNIKPGTAKRYLVSLGRAAATFDGKFVDEIDRKLIAGFVSARKKQKATNATIKRDLTAISSVLGACISWAWCDDNPAMGYGRGVLKERRDPIMLPLEDDIAVVISRCPGGLAGMARWAQVTGMRQEECAGLERPQVDAKRKVVTLTQTKTNRPRAVTLDDRALGTYSGTPAHIKSKWVFWHDDGERYANVASRFRAIVLKAYKDGAITRPFRFHDLRHWFAVDYLRRGGNIYTLRGELGHRSLQTTEIYLRYLTPTEAEQAKYGSAQNPAQV